MRSSNTFHPNAAQTRHRRLRLAGAVAAAVLTVTLAACGSSESDRAEDLAASAAVVTDIPQALEELEKSFGNPEPLSQEELRKLYDDWLAGKTGAGAESSSTSASTSTTTTSEQPTSAGADEALAVGDCTDHLPTGAEDTAADIAAVDCAGEHLTEVYLSVPLGHLGPNYPRHADILDAATQGCGAGFVEYVGGPWLDSPNTFQFVTPTKASWAEGDTAALCYAYPVSIAPFTGSLQGSSA